MPDPATSGSTPVSDPARPVARKQFSIAQAEATLPYVSRVALDIVDSYEQVIELRHELEYMDEGALYDLTRGEYDVAMERLGVLVDELHAVGAELRDFEHGRVHFPGTHLDRNVSLVWQPGESSILHWADADAGGHELLPIADLLAA